MKMNTPKDRYLPDKEIAYRYTNAMLFGQEMELNMKAILHTIDYSFDDLEDSLHKSQLQQHKTFDKFLEKATAGSLREKLRNAGIMWSKKMLRIIDKAIATRNNLAHEFLVQLHLPPPNDEQHEAILNDLNERITILYQAMRITRESRKNIEEMSEEQHERINSMMREFGIEPLELNKGLWNNKDTNQ